MYAERDVNYGHPTYKKAHGQDVKRRSKAEGKKKD
jgi:hypothetical protein